MRTAFLLLFFACGYEAPSPVVLGPDGGVIGRCDAQWCELQLDDGGMRTVGAP